MRTEEVSYDTTKVKPIDLGASMLLHAVRDDMHRIAVARG